METTPIHYSTRMSVDRNIQERWTTEETVTHTLVIQLKKFVDIRYRTTSARKGQATIGHPFPHLKTL